MRVALVASALACAACNSGSGGTPSIAAGGSSPATTPPPVSVTVSTPAASPAASATPDGLSACAPDVFDELTLTQKAGQLVMVGVPASSPSSGRTTVRSHHLGGVFLHGRTSRSAASLRGSIADLPGQTLTNGTIGLLVSTDQEGGEVQSLRGGSWTTIPSALTQGTWSASKLTSRTATWTAELAKAGLNMDLAPVADTVPPGFAAENPPIGVFHREYGDDPDDVAAAITTVVGAMSHSGVIPTVKHFPGLGRVRYNTDTSTKAVDSQTSTTSSYLNPFVAGMKAGAGAVMVSSARYTKIDPDSQAVFSSKVVTDLLRDQLGWKGVVMTDDLGQAVAVQSVPTGQRAVRFIRAGGDITLTVVTSKAATMVDAIVAEAKKSKTFSAEVDAAVRRVLALKQRNGLLTCR